MSDAVNHPDHYKFDGVEVIQLTEQLSFNRGNAVKYIARAGKKDPDLELEDLEKAEFYVKREIELIRRQWDSTPAYNVVPVDESFWLDIDWIDDMYRREARELLVPRVWESLADVPKDVQVTDFEGDVWTFKLGVWGFVRDGEGPWIHILYGPSWDEEGPFTEVLS